MSKKLSEKKLLHSHNVAQIENRDFNVRILTEKSSSIIEPIEEFLSNYPVDYIQLKEMQINSFPDLFQTRGLKDDKESVVPVFKTTPPIKFFASLLEAEAKIFQKRNKKKIIN